MDNLNFTERNDLFLDIVKREIQLCAKSIDSNGNHLLSLRDLKKEVLEVGEESIGFEKNFSDTIIPTAICAIKLEDTRQKNNKTS